MLPLCLQEIIRGYTLLLSFNNIAASHPAELKRRKKVKFHTYHYHLFKYYFFTYFVFYCVALTYNNMDDKRNRLQKEMNALTRGKWPTQLARHYIEHLLEWKSMEGKWVGKKFDKRV